MVSCFIILFTIMLYFISVFVYICNKMMWLLQEKPSIALCEALIPTNCKYVATL